MPTARRDAERSNESTTTRSLRPRRAVYQKDKNRHPGKFQTTPRYLLKENPGLSGGWLSVFREVLRGWSATQEQKKRSNRTTTTPSPPRKDIHYGEARCLRPSLAHGERGFGAHHDGPPLGPPRRSGRGLVSSRDHPSPRRARPPWAGRAAVDFHGRHARAAKLHRYWLPCITIRRYPRRGNPRPATP